MHFSRIYEKRYIQIVLVTLTLWILMNLPIHIDTKSIGLPICYFKGAQV